MIVYYQSLFKGGSRDEKENLLRYGYNVWMVLWI